MFNKDFYPTPESLIMRMFTKIEKEQTMNILEPSAGKGNIVDYFQDKIIYSKKNWKIDCIEIEDELQGILKSKGYKVIYNDFLRFFTLKKYDLIVMNPPFSNGDRHLLKAIELIENYGGQIACILNAETIKNPCSIYRQDLKIKLENYNADIEFIQNAFIGAERKTAVEVALIYINIPSNLKESDILKKLRKAKRYEEKNIEYSQVTKTDFIQSIVDKYNFEVQAGIKLIEEYLNISPIIKNSFGEFSREILSLKVNDSESNLINNYIESIRYKYWEALFSADKFRKLFTSELLKQFQAKITELKDYEFNEFNILQLQQDMSNKLVKSVEQTILDLFEDLSYKHSYNEEFSKNIHYYNGWKSNDAYKINKKVIIPLKATDWWYNKFAYSYSIYEKLADIEKVLNYLNNKEIESIDLEKVLQENLRAQQNKNIDCKYFILTFYKKGTCHLVFKDDDLLLKFNIFGSQKKGWLPGGYGKKAYNDMSDDERKVIDEFQGKKEYEKVVNNQNLYITNLNNNLLMLE